MSSFGDAVLHPTSKRKTDAAIMVLVLQIGATRKAAPVYTTCQKRSLRFRFLILRNAR